MMSGLVDAQQSVATLIIMYNVRVAKEEATGPPCRGKDVGNGFPKEGIFALNCHTGSKKFNCSSLEHRMCACGQWAGREPSQNDL